MAELLNFEDFKEGYQQAPVEEYPNQVCEAVPNPMVSVHVGTYQHADFIRDCLDGVLMQETDFPIEILIGEDESDDGTREICKEYADRHPERIRLFLHRRVNNIHIQGQPTGKFQQTYTRFMCRGKYVALCQGDDYWTDPKKLQEQVSFLEANQEYVLSHHDASIVNGQGDLLESSKLPDKNKKDFSREGLMKGPFLLTLSLCYRNVLEGYPSEYFEVLNSDKFLISQLGQYGHGGYQSNVGPSTYRKHENSIWGTKPDFFRDKILANTFCNLAKYYRKKENIKVVVYYEKRCLKRRKDVYNKSLNKSEHKSSVYYMFLIIKQYLSKNRYGEAIEYLTKAMRLFYASVIRNKFVR